MTLRFRHVALIGKYQASGARVQGGVLDAVMSEIASFLESQGCEVVVEQSTDEVHPNRVATAPSRSTRSASNAISASWWAATAPCWVSVGNWRAMACR